MAKRKKRLPFGKVREVFSRNFVMTDPWVLDVTFASVIANLYKNNPVWLFVVAPPSGMKSELINSMKEISYVYPLSDLTGATFASGLGRGDQDCSLLTKLDNQVLTLKDFTTVLSKNHETLEVVLSQLREIYDGKFDKTFGNGKELHWEGHLGFVAGCTEVIDTKRMMHSILGERFVLYRVGAGDRLRVARKALSNANSIRTIRTKVGEVVKRFLEPFDEELPRLPPLPAKIRTTLMHLADFTAYGRVPVVRERNTKTIEYIASPESPARLVQIFGMIAQAVAMLNGRRTIGEPELRIIRKIASDTMMRWRRDLFYVLAKAGGGPLTTQELSEAVRIPAKTTILHLEDMMVVDCVNRDIGSDSVKVGEQTFRLGSRGKQGYKWTLTKEFSDKIKRTGIFG